MEFQAKAPTKIDFKKAGLMVGLEFHQQVLAPYNEKDIAMTHGSKLFCPCPAYLRDDESDIKVIRKFRAVSGETGDIDITAQFEKNKQSTTIYEAFHDTTCLIELDEEPILPINEEALYRTLTMAKKLFNLELVDEILINRKTIIDGSNTSGFQRTAQIAYGSENSFIEVDGKRIGIYQANLEEDSAKNVGKEGKTRKFRLDRLGIPLIEIATSPDIRSPDEALATAKRIGGLLRTTGFVKRGQGTIRQDLNVSIKKGTRIEIKGVSELDLLPLYVTNESIRQDRMLELISIIKSRNITSKKLNPTKSKDVTKSFKKCKAKFVQSALKRKESIIGFKMADFAGLIGFEIQPDYRLGSEFAEISKVTAGVGGILHSDELPKFGITQDEVEAVQKSLKTKENDAFILLIGPANLANLAIEGIKNTISLWLSTKGLIPEVRSPRADGTTGFLRPLPGQARMYPETDSKPIELTKDLIKRIDETKFEMPEERSKRYRSELKLSEELANQLVLHPQNTLFEEIITKHKVEPKLVASTLISTMIDIRRQGFDIQKFSNARYHEMFDLVASGELSSESLSQIIIGAIENQEQSMIDLLGKLGLKKMDVSEIEEIIVELVKDHQDMIEERGMSVMGGLMGKAMAKLSGRADGKLVSSIIRKEIQALMK
ncbi:MAG: Glu-tRNA(Gln) amidotransferase subunit GatE [Candidatus Heimdallarchaeota archaeon]|nr:Glu-tRNA(Gln) amidotransferase subunit GatE [Candidatus Heimdallarchaeota archaeon]